MHYRFFSYMFKNEPLKFFKTMSVGDVFKYSYGYSSLNEVKRIAENCGFYVEHHKFEDGVMGFKVTGKVVGPTEQTTELYFDPNELVT